MEQLGLTLGKRLRDKGIEQVTEHNKDWHSKAVAAMSQLQGSRQEMSADQIQNFILGSGVAEPNHYNAWGAVIRSAVKSGLICDTGKCVLSQKPASHARRLVVWMFK